MKPDPSKICFGLSEELDRSSFAQFLRLSGTSQFADVFAHRLSSEEIIHLSDQFMVLIRKHLNEQEYHSLFLQDQKHHHHEPGE
ncbi:MAG: hypothetical protein ACN4GW_09130 [Desulforhopalus sp.]